MEGASAPLASSLPHVRHRWHPTGVGIGAEEGCLQDFALRVNPFLVLRLLPPSSPGVWALVGYVVSLALTAGLGGDPSILVPSLPSLCSREGSWVSQSWEPYWDRHTAQLNGGAPGCAGDPPPILFCWHLFILSFCRFHLFSSLYPS